MTNDQWCEILEAQQLCLWLTQDKSSHSWIDCIYIYAYKWIEVGSSRQTTTWPLTSKVTGLKVFSYMLPSDKNTDQAVPLPSGFHTWSFCKQWWLLRDVYFSPDCSVVALAICWCQLAQERLPWLMLWNNTSFTRCSQVNGKAAPLVLPTSITARRAERERKKWNAF